MMNESLSAINIESLTNAVSSIVSTGSSNSICSSIISTPVVHPQFTATPIMPISLPATNTSSGLQVSSLPTLLPSNMPFFITMSPAMELLSRDRSIQDRAHLLTNFPDRQTYPYQTTHVDPNRITPLLTAPLGFPLPFPPTQADRSASTPFNLSMHPPPLLLQPHGIPVVKNATMPMVVCSTVATTSNYGDGHETVTSSQRSLPATSPQEVDSSDSHHHDQEPHTATLHDTLNISGLSPQSHGSDKLNVLGHQRLPSPSVMGFVDMIIGSPHKTVDHTGLHVVTEHYTPHEERYTELGHHEVHSDHILQTQQRLDHALQILAKHVKDPTNHTTQQENTTENHKENETLLGQYPPGSSDLNWTMTNTLGKYCVDCNHMYADQCTIHTMSYERLEDSPILPMAQATLPSQLELKTVTGLTDRAEMGVFAKKEIKKRTLLGPLIGENLPDEVDLDNKTHTWPVYEGDRRTVIYCKDETKCNWMMFVRKASKSEEQNLYAFQQDGCIYFVSTSDIQPGKELLHWYSKEYSILQGLSILPGSAVCSICKKSFPDIKAVEQHINQSHATRKFRCESCNKGFSSSSKLKVHELTHIGMKPHTCDICQKRFTDVSNLKVHEKIHTGEKNHKCTVCDKTFRQKAHLQSHMYKHTGEKKNNCEYCGRMFARTSDLKIHIYSHTKEKVFNCEFCDKIFYKRQNYLKHTTVIHSGIKKFQCEKCSKKFQSKFHLTRHFNSCKNRKVKEPSKTIPRLGTKRTRENLTNIKEPSVTYNVIIKEHSDSAGNTQ